MFSLNIWLHQYARRAVVYHVNKVKRIGPPVRAIISRRQTWRLTTPQTRGSAR
jgi:hypothetical protein